MIYRLLLDQALTVRSTPPEQSSIRLLKQTAKENLRHKEQLSLFAHR